MTDPLELELERLRLPAEPPRTLEELVDLLELERLTYPQREEERDDQS